MHLTPKSNGQSKEVETTTDLTENDNANHLYESTTDTETTCEPMTQPPLEQSDTPPTFEINDPTTEDIPQTEPSQSRGGKYNLRPNPNPKYSEIYIY